MMLRARLLSILRLLQLVRRLALILLLLLLLLQLLLRGTAVAIRVEASSSAVVIRSAELHVHSVTSAEESAFVAVVASAVAACAAA